MLEDNDVEGAIAECDKQRGSLANVLRLGLERYQVVKDDPIEAEK